MIYSLKQTLNGPYYPDMMTEAEQVSTCSVEPELITPKMPDYSAHNMSLANMYKFAKPINNGSTDGGLR